MGILGLQGVVRDQSSESIISITLPSHTQPKLTAPLTSPGRKLSIAFTAQRPIKFMKKIFPIR